MYKYIKYKSLYLNFKKYNISGGGEKDIVLEVYIYDEDTHKMKPTFYNIQSDVTEIVFSKFLMDEFKKNIDTELLSCNNVFYEWDTDLCENTVFADIHSVLSYIKNTHAPKLYFIYFPNQTQDILLSNLSLKIYLKEFDTSEATKIMFLKRNIECIRFIEEDNIVNILKLLSSNNIEENLILDIITYRPYLYEYINSSTKTPEFIKKAIDNNGLIIKYLDSKELPFCRIAAMHKMDMLEYIPNKFWKDGEIIHNIIQAHDLKSIYNSQQLFICHIGFSKLETNIFTKDYIDYEFIEFSIIDSKKDVDNIISKLTQLLIDKNTYDIVIFITLDFISYSNFITDIQSNLNKYGKGRGKGISKDISPCTTWDDIDKKDLLTYESYIEESKKTFDITQYSDTEAYILFINSRLKKDRFCRNSENKLVPMLSLLYNDKMIPTLDMFYKTVITSIIDKTNINTPKIKIINVCNSATYKFKCLNLFDVNHSFYKIININFTTNEEDDTLKKLDTKIIINKNVYLHMHEQKNLAIHWINWYINTPNILSKRIQQFTGTCWLNSTLNILFLVPDILNDIYIEYSIYEKIYLETRGSSFPISLKDLRDDSMITHIEDIIFSIIGHFKNENKTNIYDDDYISALGAYLKSNIASSIKEFKLITIFKDIHDTYKLPLYKYCSANDNNPMRTQLCKSPVNSDNISKLNNICQYKKNSICTQFDKITDEYKGYIYGRDGYTSGILLLLKIIYNKIFEFDKIIELNNINILLQTNDISDSSIKYDKTIYKEGCEYKLSSIYLVNDNHAITAIIDNNNFYVYDSGTNTISNETNNLDKVLLGGYVFLNNLKKDTLLKYECKQTRMNFIYCIDFLIYTHARA